MTPLIGSTQRMDFSLYGILVYHLTKKEAPMKNKFEPFAPFLAMILLVFIAGNAIADNKVVVIPIAADAQELVTDYYGGANLIFDFSTSRSVASASVTAKSDGTIIATGSTTVAFGVNADEAACSLSTFSGATEPDYNQYAGNADGTTIFNISTVRHLPVSTGSHTVHLNCKRTIGSGTISIYRPQLSLLFVPD